MLRRTHLAGLMAAAFAGHAALALPVDDTTPPAPAAAPTKAPPAAPPATPAATPPAPAAALPASDALLALELEARGGKDAIEAVRHMTSTGFIEFTALGIKAPMTTRLSEPSKFLTVVEISKGAEIRTGYDGTVGWSIDPALGPRLLEGKELEQIRLEANFAGQSSIATRYAESKVVAETTWQKKPAYEVLLKSPDREATVYIDKESHLITGMKMVTETVRGSIPVTMNFTEYKAFDGPKGKVTMPVRSEMVMMGMTNALTVEKVDFTEIDATLFDLPAPIKALVEKPATATPPAAAPTPTPTPTPTQTPTQTPSQTPSQPPAQPASPAKPTSEGGSTAEKPSSQPK